MVHALYPRLAAQALRESLTDTPVVLIHGPRQCGKTTLAKYVGGDSGYVYFSFDDATTLAAAQTDPNGFVADLPERVILDEVQRAPEIFAAVKSDVDRRRTPGRFLLTGSSNVLLVPTLSDSLAGRIGILRLHPLAQAEIERVSPCFIETLFAGDFKMRSYSRLGGELAERIASGGFPAAISRAAGNRRAAWYRDYLDALVQRDVRDIARIASLDALPRLLALLAGQTARLINISDLAAPFQLSRPTIGSYVTLLERVFLVDMIPPWHVNRMSRSIKSPKIHLGDTGLASALLGEDADSLAADKPLLGQLAETFVLQELAREATGADVPTRFFHYRDRDNFEVDIVLERGANRLAAVEVKTSATVVASDFRGLRKLRDLAGKRFRTGVVLYDGETTVGFGDSMFAVPIRSLWET